MSVTILPRSSWTDTPFAWPRYSSRLFDKSKVEYVAVHYPAVAKAFGVMSEASEQGWLRTIRSWHVNPEPAGRGWADIGYAIVVCQSGRAYFAGGITHSTAHAGTANPISVGILMLVGNDEQPTPEAIATFNAIARWLRDSQGFTALKTVIDHGRLPGQSTSCAGVPIRTAIDAGKFTLGDTPMAKIAENGWSTVPLSSTAPFLAPNGKIVYARNWDIATILGYVAWRWHFSVGPLHAATYLEGDSETNYRGGVRDGLVVIHSWRPAALISGSNYYSIHGTAMGMDLNGHLHPYEYFVVRDGGVWRSGFTDAQVTELRRIKAEVRALAGGVDILRLGLDFPVGRRDGMHVELWGTSAQMAAAAAAIRASGWLIPFKRGDIKAYQAFAGASADDFHGAGTTLTLKGHQGRLGLTRTGRWDLATRTALVQERLKALGYDPGPIDGIPGDRFNEALGKFQRANLLKDDLIPGAATLNALRTAKPVAPAPKPDPVKPPAEEITPIKPTPEPTPPPIPTPSPPVPAPERLAGSNRYATAARVAIDAGLKKVYLAVGNSDTLADAVSAAARGDGSLLYVRRDSLSLPGDTEAALREIKPTEIVAVGDHSVVPDELVAMAYRAAGLPLW